MSIISYILIAIVCGLVIIIPLEKKKLNMHSFSNL